jgi:hypothetical protein
MKKNLFERVLNEENTMNKDIFNNFARDVKKRIPGKVAAIFYDTVIRKKAAVEEMLLDEDWHGSRMLSMKKETPIMMLKVSFGVEIRDTAKEMIRVYLMCRIEIHLSEIVSRTIEASYYLKTVDNGESWELDGVDLT